MKKIFMLLAFVLLLTACTSAPVDENLPNIGENVLPKEENQSPAEDISSDNNEESVAPSDEDYSVKFSEEYISPYQVLTEEDALEITGGKLYNYAPLDTDSERAYITPTGKLVYISDYDYSEMCRTEAGSPSVFDYETVGPTDFEVNFVDKVRQYDVDPDEKLGYEPVGLKIYDYRENQKYIKVVASNFDTHQVWYELHAKSYQIKIEGTDSHTDMIGCYGIAKSGNAWFELGFQAQSDDFVISEAGFNAEDTYFGSDDSMYTKIASVRKDLSDASHAVQEYRFLARIWDGQSRVAHYELISVKITREYNDIVLTVTNYEDEIDPLYLGEGVEPLFPDGEVVPVPAEPVPEPVPPEDPVVPQEPIVEPIVEPIEPVPVESIEPSEPRFYPGAALTEVEKDVPAEYLYMSADEAQKLTKGLIIPYPEENIEGRNAYLTPSGKLVYMDEWTYGKLPEGTVDFAVDWSSPDNSYSPAGMSSKKRKVDGSVVELVSSYEVKDVKYDLYVDYISSMDSLNPVDTIGCYGIVVEGYVEYSYGFKVDSEKYEGCTVKYTVNNENDVSMTFSGNIGDSVMIESRKRDFRATNRDATGYSDGLLYFVTAEIIDGRGAVVYKEEFKLFEIKEFANHIDLWAS